jgi:hypothetical protein
MPAHVVCAGGGALRETELAWWGPLAVDATLARVNEPCRSPPQRANVTALEAAPTPRGDAGGDAGGVSGDGYTDSLLFTVTRPVEAGEELLISYGENYDRSGY